MFSDTHFHFHYLAESKEINEVEILQTMANNNCYFGLDIGTKADDLLYRQSCVDKAIANINDYKIAQKVRSFMYFSAGIWPSTDEITNRHQRIELLKQQIQQANESKDNDTLHRKIIAIGECGLDHHWNPSGVDGRCENDFDSQMFLGEKELFQMQLQLAKELNLPVIVHSRDAFEDTLDCIKKVGYHNGIIHCYSYGIQEAKAFLDLGWHISFSGSVTYAKKSKIEEMLSLIKSIPTDKLLCETDAPYLAPVPCRGQTNIPPLVEHTYNFVANARGITTQELCQIVDSNIKKLFNVTV